MSVMLYKKGIELVWEGLALATKVVHETEVDAHLALGWVLHPHETIETEQYVGDPVPDPVEPQTEAANAALSAPPVVNPFAPKA